MTGEDVISGLLAEVSASPEWLVLREYRQELIDAYDACAASETTAKAKRDAIAQGQDNIWMSLTFRYAPEEITLEDHPARARVIFTCEVAITEPARRETP